MIFQPSLKKITRTAPVLFVSILVGVFMMAGVDSRPVQAAGAPPSAPTGGALSVSLDDVQGVVRKQVEELALRCSGPAAIQVRRVESKIIVLFENVQCGVDQGIFKPVGLDNVQQIAIMQRQIRNKPVVGVTIDLVDAASGSNSFLFQVLPDRCLIFLPHTGPEGIVLWSVKNGSMLSYEFPNLQTKAVDLAGIARMANRDLKSAVSDSKLFSLSQSSPPPPKPVVAPPPLPKPAAIVETAKPVPIPKTGAAEMPNESKVRLTITKDHVNLRADPSGSQTDNIIMKLTKGTAATLLERKNDWVRIKLDDETIGWVNAGMVFERVDNPAAVSANTAPVTSAIKVTATASPSAVPAIPVTPPPPVVKQETIPASSPVVPDTIVKTTDTVAEAPPKPKTIVYQRLGRDPFLPISADDLMQDGVVNVENAHLVGILYDNDERVALLEDQTQGGVAYALREGDAVMKGKVLKIQPDKVVFLLNDLGTSHTFAIKLKSDKKE
jgi:hypothetical protein